MEGLAGRRGVRRAGRDHRAGVHLGRRARGALAFAERRALQWKGE
jgi:hypothetical protein